MERTTARTGRTEQPPDATPRGMSDAVLNSVAILRTSDGGCFAVFKKNLSAPSVYFDALFNGPLSEPSRVDFIPGLSKEALQAIATYASVGDVAITADNAEDVTVAADQLLVDVAPETALRHRRGEPQGL